MNRTNQHGYIGNKMMNEICSKFIEDNKEKMIIDSWRKGIIGIILRNSELNKEEREKLIDKVIEQYQKMKFN